MRALDRVTEYLGMLPTFTHYAVGQADKGREKIVDRRPHVWLGDGI